MGITWTEANQYSGKFITDLLLAEYDDFVAAFNEHRAAIASDI